MIYQTQLENKVYDLLAPSLEGMGYDIVRIRVSNNTAGKLLQIMIEKTDGALVNVSDCEKASRHSAVLLDVESVIDSQYNLEMSSTGLDKPLTRLKDFEAALGNVAKVSLKVPMNGQKRFSGVVKSVHDGIISMDCTSPAEVIDIDFNNIVEAHLDYFANNKKTKKGAK